MHVKHKVERYPVTFLSAGGCAQEPRPTTCRLFPWTWSRRKRLALMQQRLAPTLTLWTSLMILQVNPAKLWRTDFEIKCIPPIFQRVSLKFFCRIVRHSSPHSPSRCLYPAPSCQDAPTDPTDAARDGAGSLSVQPMDVASDQATCASGDVADDSDLLRAPTRRLDSFAEPSGVESEAKPRPEPLSGEACVAQLLESEPGLVTRREQLNAPYRPKGKGNDDSDDQEAEAEDGDNSKPEPKPKPKGKAKAKPKGKGKAKAKAKASQKRQAKAKSKPTNKTAAKTSKTEPEKKGGCIGDGDQEAGSKGGCSDMGQEVPSLGSAYASPAQRSEGCVWAEDRAPAQVSECFPGLVFEGGLAGWSWVWTIVPRRGVFFLFNECPVVAWSPVQVPCVLEGSLLQALQQGIPGNPLANRDLQGLLQSCRGSGGQVSPGEIGPMLAIFYTSFFNASRSLVVLPYFLGGIFCMLPMQIIFQCLHAAPGVLRRCLQGDWQEGLNAPRLTEGRVLRLVDATHMSVKLGSCVGTTTVVDTPRDSGFFLEDRPCV